jgi:hypothetical protein
MTKRERRRRAKCERRQLRKLARLGISNFESIDKTQQRQTDRIARLEQAHIDSGYTAGFEDCGPYNCGKVKCSEGCAFGTRKRRLEEIIAVHRLMTKVDGPICEVRLIRGVWARPAGKLRGVSIAAAKKLVRRALDNVYNPDIVAVGTFKVSFSSADGGPRWIAEIHQIVAGATKEELDKVLCRNRPDRNVNFLRVEQVNNLGQSICEVLRREPQVWQHPSRNNEPSSARPKKQYRAEYYEWQLRLRLGARMIRYGCDRYFNPLKKKPRVVRPKVRKKRPYPYWLVRRMFGSHPQNCKCVRCNGAYPLN